MALTINTNVASLNAQRNLNNSQGLLGKSMQRLSSGLRINGAADDAAGLAISENMRGTIRCLNQAVRNANDGVSMIQIAEGALNETSNILIRMKELSEQSATGTLGSTERGYIQDEFDKLSSEIDRIALSTEFNGTKVLDGTLSASGLAFQIGTRNVTANDRITLTVNSAKASDIGLAPASITLTTQTDAQNALATLDDAIKSVVQLRGNLGATQNRLTSTINNLQISIENTSAAESRIRDVDVAMETANLTKNNILVQAGTSILAQANQSPQAALSLLKG
jgi:flagellin